MIKHTHCDPTRHENLMGFPVRTSSLAFAFLANSRPRQKPRCVYDRPLVGCSQAGICWYWCWTMVGVVIFHIVYSEIATIIHIECAHYRIGSKSVNAIHTHSFTWLRVANWLLSLSNSLQYADSPRCTAIIVKTIVNTTRKSRETSEIFGWTCELHAP